MLYAIRRLGEQVVGTKTNRRDYSLDHDPYPGSPIKIRQDFCPNAYTNTLMDVAPCFGASSGLRIGGGLAVPDRAQEGDPLSGSPVFFADIFCPDGPLAASGLFFWIYHALAW